MSSKQGGFSCSCRGCNSRSGDCALFQFPKDADRAKLWMKYCNREDLMTKLSNENWFKSHKVCERHFESKFISTNSDVRKRLLPDAYPTLFVPLPDETREPPQKVSISSDIRLVEPSQTSVPEPTHQDVSCYSKPGSSQQSVWAIIEPSLAASEILSLAVPGPSSYVTTPESSALLSPVGTQTSASLSSHSPRKEKLRQRLKTLRRKSQATKSDEKKEWTIQDFNNLCEKFLHKDLAEIVKVQAYLNEKSPKARRYSREYKQFALTLYFLGPRAYAFISKFLYLPSKRSLERITEKVVCKPGLENMAIFAALEIKMKTMLDQDKHCILCIDEMSLKANLFFHIGRDEIVGFHDVGDGKKELLPAQNAAVLMARGLYSNWKQPIAYFFLHSTYKADKLKPMIELCISKLTTLGLQVEALVSDMGSNFCQLAASFGVTTDNCSFVVGDKTILYLFDTCHLLKATRNNLMKNSFLFDGKTTSWSYVEEFYNRDKQNFYRCAHKLTNSHLHPNNFEKMKVKLAAQVLSHTVASGMYTHMSLGALSTDALGTIEIIEKFDKLFDILNSTDKDNPNIFKNVFRGDEYQITYLNEMLELIGKMVLHNRQGQDITNKVKFKNCWIITLNGMKQLWTTLSSYNFKYLKTRKVNQDAVENFFGSIRQQGGNCVNPTPIQFERSFKKLFSQSYLHTNNMNCKDDFDHLLSNIQSADIEMVDIENEPTPALSLLDYDYRREDILTQNPFVYVCGYLLKKALKIHRCQVCLDYSKNCEELDTDKLLTHFRSFDTNSSIFGGLRMPPEAFIHFVYKLEQIFNSTYEDVCTGVSVSNSHLSIMQIVKFQHPCSQFPILYVLKLFIRLRIFYSLKYLNRDMKSLKDKNKRKLSILSHI